MVAPQSRGHRKAGGASKAVSPLFVCRPDKLSCLCCEMDAAGSSAVSTAACLLSDLRWAPLRRAACLSAVPHAVGVSAGVDVICFMGCHGSRTCSTLALAPVPCRHANLPQRVSSHRSASSNERTAVTLLLVSQQFQTGHTPSSTLRISDCN